MTKTNDITDSTEISISKSGFVAIRNKSKQVIETLEADLINEKVNNKKITYQLEAYKDVAVRLKNDLEISKKENQQYRTKLPTKISKEMLINDNKCKDISKIVDEKFKNCKKELDGFMDELNELF